MQLFAYFKGFMLKLNFKLNFVLIAYYKILCFDIKFFSKPFKQTQTKSI